MESQEILSPEIIEQINVLGIWSKRWTELGVPNSLLEIKKELGIRKLGKTTETPNFLSLKISDTPLVCLDIDAPESSIQSFMKILDQNGISINDLFYEKTRNNGYHFFFRGDKSGYNSFENVHLGVHYDFLTRGRVFTTPSSFKGRSYTFGEKTPFNINSLEEIPETPEWIKEFLCI